VLDVLISTGEAGDNERRADGSRTAATAVPPKRPNPPATLTPPPVPSAVEPADHGPPADAPQGLADLERRLWDAANALRGPVDPADFKTYVFPMLFWKWTSDTWDWEHATAVEEFGEDVPAEVEADYHRFSLPVGTHWRQVTTRTANLVCEIGKALGRIEQANPISLAGIFGDAAWGNKERLPAPSLVALVNAFNGLVLNPDQV
jgi:hypothetical protein